MFFQNPVRGIRSHKMSVFRPNDLPCRQNSMLQHPNLVDHFRACDVNFAALVGEVTMLDISAAIVRYATSRANRPIATRFHFEGLGQGRASFSRQVTANWPMRPSGSASRFDGRRDCDRWRSGWACAAASGPPPAATTTSRCRWSDSALVCDRLARANQRLGSRAQFSRHPLSERMKDRG